MRDVFDQEPVVQETHDILDIAYIDAVHRTRNAFNDLEKRAKAKLDHHQNELPTINTYLGDLPEDHVTFFNYDGDDDYRIADLNEFLQEDETKSSKIRRKLGNFSLRKAYQNWKAKPLLRDTTQDSENYETLASVVDINTRRNLASRNAGKVLTSAVACVSLIAAGGLFVRTINRDTDRVTQVSIVNELASKQIDNKEPAINIADIMSQVLADIETRSHEIAEAEAAEAIALEAARAEQAAIEAVAQEQAARLSAVSIAAQTTPHVHNKHPNASNKSSESIRSVEEVKWIIQEAAKRWNRNVDDALSIAECESSFNEEAVGPGDGDNYRYGKPMGVFQHREYLWPERAAKYGHPGASIFDTKAQADVTMQMWNNGEKNLWACR